MLNWIMQVQILLTELTMVEEEIIWLERKVDELKLNLYQEKKQTKDWEMLRLKDLQPQCGQWHKKPLIPKQKIRTDQAQHKKHRIIPERRISVDSSMDLQSSSLFGPSGKSYFPFTRL